jgi:hypothetical protein
VIRGVEIIMVMKNEKPIQLEKNKSEANHKQTFVKPKFIFVEPKLVKHGDVKDITAGKWGSYYY